MVSTVSPIQVKPTQCYPFLKSNLHEVTPSSQTYMVSMVSPLPRVKPTCCQRCQPFPSQVKPTWCPWCHPFLVLNLRAVNDANPFFLKSNLQTQINVKAESVVNSAQMPNATYKLGVCSVFWQGLYRQTTLRSGAHSRTTRRY